MQKLHKSIAKAEKADVLYRKGIGHPLTLLYIILWWKRCKPQKSKFMRVHAIEQYQMEQHLPTGKGRRVVKILRPFFLISTDLIKDYKILSKITQRCF